ncbi:sigma-54-dependent transcriptional regulator [Taibaiella soli]|uniref:Sigma-54-dependent Fis family transcriptional regulator n=1 Tax=Taibaiella soli TaxID=1649169 RepID=A0A2W2AGR5_9BACT|nr:sigma-54 dependent transcriptional regulator [Taibaiella soli]PZF72712.1 sigma-54-dependent Fis family transcriptional regulator [Taibaiella soli]
MAHRILIVEDQFIEANNLKLTLKKAGYQVCSIARSVPDALEIIDFERPEIVLLDIFLQGPQTGIDLASMLNEKNIPFVFLSANSNRQTLDAAKATNPCGFLVKPFREKDVLVTLDVALYIHQQKQTAIDTPGAVPKIPSDNKALADIIGKSAGITEILEQVTIVSKSDTSVLVLGESGTGKELIAQAIHSLSRRSAGPLVVVNCGALPANLIESELFGHEKGAFTGATEKRIGRFEAADGGTVFLDEIGELPPDLQVKFLRVLQEKEIEPIGGKKKKINVRVIAATNRVLEDEMAAGRFRMDLYYRLNVFPLTLPPLRNRKEDILLLAEYFLNLYAKREQKNITGFTEQVAKTLAEYSWPGNIRELENLMERSVLLTTGRLISSVALPSAAKKVNATTTQLKTMTENERDHILAVLQHCDWKIYGQGGAAEMLDMNASTLQSRMKKLGIEKKISHRNPGE